MNKIQTIGQKKTQRKSQTETVALPQVAASKIPHLKGSNFQSRATLRRAAVKKDW